MSITHERIVPCRCGAEVVVTLVESLNAARHPHLRQQVIDRTLHMAACEACGRTTMVAARLVYVDLQRRQLIGVYLPSDRPQARVCSEEVVRVYERYLRGGPAPIRALADDCLVRAVFGYEELREKLVGDDAGLSDLAIEATKYELLGDARLQEKGAATLRLDEVADGLARFHVEDVDGRPLQGRIDVPRAAIEALPGREALLATYPGIASGPHVSVLRLVWAGTPVF